MALYTDFSLEAEREDIAAAGAASFRQGPLRVHGIEIALRRSDVFERGGMWYFLAEPAGYTNGSHITRELNTPQAFLAIREECYGRIAGLREFRRAAFGHEACDFLSDPETRWRFDYPGLLVREDLVRYSSIMDQCSRFSADHLRVIDARKNA
jgi:hypothetical protein